MAVVVFLDGSKYFSSEMLSFPTCLPAESSDGTIRLQKNIAKSQTSLNSSVGQQGLRLMRQGPSWTTAATKGSG